jgi:hypothetical protein
MSQGNFFAIDRQIWDQVLVLGMNSACTFLVMARGTQKNNRTTKWSVNATEKYTGIGRRRCKDAQSKLLNSEVIEKIKGGKRPSFKIKKECDDENLIWLPNELVTGIKNAVPPLERVRQTSDVLCLRLLIDFYYINSPVEDGGIPRECVYEKYEKIEISETGNMIVYGFKNIEWSCYTGHPVVKPHMMWNEDDEAQEFWDRLHILIDLGLINFFPFLVESKEKDSEFIHPIIDPYTNNSEISDKAYDLSVEMLGECYQYETEKYDCVIPVVRHRKNNTVMGIGFLRYRPKTKLTAAGYATIQERYQHWLEIYESINQEPKKIAIG